MISKSVQKISINALVRLFFGAFVGLFIGIMGGVVERPLIGILSAGFLALLLGSFQVVFHRTIGIFSGVTSGAILGVTVAILGLLLGGSITNGPNGLQFGLVRGIIIGATFGFLTRAHPDEEDTLPSRLVLLFGSIIIGAVLGGLVGLFSGFILGVMQGTRLHLFLAFVLGAIVGAYLSSYSNRWLPVIIGAFILGSLTLMGQFIGGSISGVFLGGVSGTFVPLVMMLIIGAYGGVRRGFKAMIVEMIQTPREMILQSAVPMLAPAMLVGLIIGTAAEGIGSILVMPIIFAVVGMSLGAFGELEGRQVNRVTPRATIELLILGADRWPIRRLIKRLRAQRLFVLQASLTGFILGLLGGGAGAWLGQLLTEVMLRNGN